MKTAPTPLAPAAGALFRAIASLRGDRALHPDGVAIAGTFMPTAGPHAPASPLFQQEQPRRALVRMSRGLGLPEPLPDACGCAIRVLDAHGSARHQDFLLSSSFEQPLARHLLVPTRDFGHAFYSSVLAYRIGGRTMLLGARLEHPAGRRIDELRRSVATGRQRLTLFMASPLGAWRQAATVTLERTAPESATTRFNPWVTGGGIAPTGPFMGMREPAYRESQAASVGAD